jgi:hypothetical protein
MTALETAALDVAAGDRIWALTRPGVLSDFVLWEWSARIVARALSLSPRPDPRSVAVVKMLRRLSCGEQVSSTERASVWDAASSAYWSDRCTAVRSDRCAGTKVHASNVASNAAWAAERDVAWAAVWNASSDDWASASEDERKLQIADVVDILTVPTTDEGK